MLESDNRSLKFLKFIDYAKSKENIEKISTSSYWNKEEVEIFAKTIRDHKNATDIVLLCRDVIHANIFLSIAEGNITDIVLLDKHNTPGILGILGPLSQVDVKEMANLLKTNKTLKSLDLSGNGIGLEGAKYIAEALKVNKDLKYLNLTDNRFYCTNAVELLFEALMVNESLEKLILQDASISTKSLALLEKRKNKNLKIANMYLEAWYGNSEDN